MSLSTILPGTSVNRAVEMLGGSDVVAGQPLTSTSQLADLGGIATTIDDLVGSATTDPSPNGNGAAGTFAQPVIDTANEVVLDVHAVLEEGGHQVAALNTPLHALTHLGETIGLGRIGTEQNLVSDILDAPSHALAGDVEGAVQPLLQDVARVASAANALADSATHVADPGTGVIGSGGLVSPVTGVADTAVGTVHAALENVGHDVPLLNTPIHALTNLGETVGLGHLGDSGGNLIVDAVQLPSSILGGQDLGTALQPVLTDVGDTLAATTGLVDSVVGIVGEGEGGLGGTLGSVLGGNGGGLGDGGGLLGGTLGHVGGEGGLLGNLGLSGSGSEPLVDVGAFGQQGTPLAVLDLLAPTRTEAPHGVDVAVLQAPEGQSSLVDLNVADSHTIDVPSLGGIGIDSLAGRLADTAPTMGSLGQEGGSTGVALPVIAELTDGLPLGLGQHDDQHHGLGHTLL